MEEGNIRNDTNRSHYFGRETVLGILRDVEPALIAAEATTIDLDVDEEDSVYGEDVDAEDSASGEDVDAEHLVSSLTIDTRELMDVRENVKIGRAHV